MSGLDYGVPRNSSQFCRGCIVFVAERDDMETVLLEHPKGDVDVFNNIVLVVKSSSASSAHSPSSQKYLSDCSPKAFQPSTRSSARKPVYLAQRM